MRVKPAGEWNTLEVTAAGKALTLWVNGAVTCQFEDCGREKGRVGLEGEGYRIEFRNLKVKALRWNPSFDHRAQDQVASTRCRCGRLAGRSGRAGSHRTRGRRRCNPGSAGYQ